LLIASTLKDYSKNIEVVKFKEKDSKIRGIVKVNLFDKDSGKKILEAKTENIITALGYEYFRWAIQDGIIRNSSFTKPTFNNPFNMIALYSANEPEKDEPYPNEGNLVGYSNLYTYSGTDTLRGTINLSESNINYNKYLRIHLVFDWPTHAANGTFQTIIWAYSYLLQFKYSSFASPDSSPRGLAWDGTNLWLAGNSTDKIYKLNPSTGEVISSFASPDSLPQGLAWDGTNLWLAGDSTDKIYKLNPSTGEVISSFASPDSSPRGLAWDGTNLWLAGDNNVRIYKLEQALYGARTLLPSPITKTSQQTMKIEYDFVFQV
jgi:outer membrane protein assembly factor BamB